MFIAETFASIQGEGRYAGVPSFFIRTSGCNLRCWFCDTPYASWEPEGVERTVGDLVDEAAATPAQHVVITGGEPMLAPAIGELTQRLCSLDRVITIETAGTVFQNVHCDLMSISPKLSNSTPRDAEHRDNHERRRHQPQVIRQLTGCFDYQLKFVVDKPADAIEIRRYLDAVIPGADDRVYLMPQATDPASLEQKLPWVSELAARHGWRISPRRHIELYGNVRGT